MSVKYDRPEIKQITRQWVMENYKNITPRDMGLLKVLFENNRRILRRDQIEVLYPTFASTDRLNKRLKQLYQMHVIDRIYPKVGLGQGSSKQHVCLDRAGCILLDLEKYNKPIGVVEGIKYLPLGWEHKVLVNDYECEIVSWCRQNEASIRIYTSEAPLLYNDCKIIPDILCLLVKNGKGYLFFIEVDTGTEDMPYVKKKLDNYVDYYLSKTWTAESWSNLFKTPTFPRVIFLTEEGRTKRVTALQDYTKDISVRFHFGFHSHLQSFLDGIVKG